MILILQCTLTVVADPAGIQREARHGLAVLNSSVRRALADLEAALVATGDGNPHVRAYRDDVLRHLP